MLRFTPLVKNAYKLTLFDNYDAYSKNTFLSYYKALNNPITVLRENSQLTREINNYLTDNRDKTEPEQISQIVADLHSKIKVQLTYYPLLLLNECNADYCAFSREQNSTMRQMVELCTLQATKRSNNICFVGCGNLFQELIILTNNKTNTSPINITLIDDMRDYFDTVLDSQNSDTNGTAYYGPNDNLHLNRALWAYLKTQRYISFMRWFAMLNYQINLYITTPLAYKTLSKHQQYPKPDLVIGIDITDDNAPAQLESYYTAALYSHPAHGMLLSPRLLHIFDTKENDPDTFQLNDFDVDGRVFMNEVKARTTQKFFYTHESRPYMFAIQLSRALISTLPEQFQKRLKYTTLGLASCAMLLCGYIMYRLIR